MLDSQSLLGSVNNSSSISYSLALSRDLGTIQSTQDPVVWAVGFTTELAVNLTDLSGGPPQQRFLYYKTKYLDSDCGRVLSWYQHSSVDNVSHIIFKIVDFLNDFVNASSRAYQLDLKILQDAALISGLLGDLVSSATAQVYGSIQLTVGVNEYGGLNQSDVMAFMKNMGGLRTKAILAWPSRVNAVETLYSAFPAFMYIDPNLGGLFLEPLFQLQSSPKYINPYAAPDLGAS
jgi:hypothetical protein